MQTFYTTKDNFTDSTVTLTGEEHHHATRSCRVRVGEMIGVLDGCGKRVHARIESIDSQSLTAVIETDVSGAGEPKMEIIVALSIIKPSRFETAIEKCTEIGARGFIPLVAERCDQNIARRIKIERLRKIALEAAKQSKRSWIPEIYPPEKLSDLLSSSDGAILAASQDADKNLERVCETISGVSKLILLIGPEGDFSDREYDAMSRAGVIPFSMGGLTLRAETAGIVAVSQAVNIFCSGC